MWIIDYLLAGRWRAGLAGDQLPFCLPLPQPSKLPKNGPGFRAEASALIKAGRSRNVKSLPTCLKAVRKRPCSVVKGPNVAPVHVALVHSVTQEVIKCVRPLTTHLYAKIGLNQCWKWNSNNNNNNPKGSHYQTQLHIGGVAEFVRRPVYIVQVKQLIRSRWNLAAISFGQFFWPFCDLGFGFRHLNNIFKIDFNCKYSFAWKAKSYLLHLNDRIPVELP